MSVHDLWIQTTETGELPDKEDAYQNYIYAPETQYKGIRGWKEEELFPYTLIQTQYGGFQKSLFYPLPSWIDILYDVRVTLPNFLAQKIHFQIKLLYQNRIVGTLSRSHETGNYVLETGFPPIYSLGSSRQLMFVITFVDLHCCRIITEPILTPPLSVDLEYTMLHHMYRNVLTRTFLLEGPTYWKSFQTFSFWLTGPLNLHFFDVVSGFEKLCPSSSFFRKRPPPPPPEPTNRPPEEGGEDPKKCALEIRIAGKKQNKLLFSYVSEEYFYYKSELISNIQYPLHVSCTLLPL